jgi:hypothetical protein
MRIDGIRMERNLGFHAWYHRVITSLLAFVATDAFYAMHMARGDIELDNFLECLYMSLRMEIFSH